MTRGFISIVFEILQFFKFLFELQNPITIFVNDFDKFGLHIEKFFALCLIKHLDLRLMSIKCQTLKIRFIFWVSDTYRLINRGKQFDIRVIISLSPLFIQFDYWRNFWQDILLFVGCMLWGVAEVFVWVIKGQPSLRVAFALLRLNSFVRRYAAFARANAKSQLG